jgi:hypothetical protein
MTTPTKSPASTNGAQDSTRGLNLLSQLLLGATANGSEIAACSATDFSNLWHLAMSHHVIVRSFPRLHELLVESGNDHAGWVEQELIKEHARIEHAASFLAPICEELEEAGDVVVIKSLDHWPDLGSDLDLYTNADSAAVVAIMRDKFKAQLDKRSWGDRLANKWNFIVPGLPELVEMHVSRLGQTGEQTAITQSLVKRAFRAQFGSHSFTVPAPEDRLMISTLQRMYRHFYVRLCDIDDNGKLVDSGAVDYSYLKALAQSAGLWDGLATYLYVISGYVKSYRGEGLPLPEMVTNAAHFGNELVHFRRNFLRIPIFPQSAWFYASEWKRLLLNGQLQSTLRLSLLPGLATAAALEMKLTGSDKGIW